MSPSRLIRFAAVAAVAAAGGAVVSTAASAEGGDGGDQAIVNLYAKPVARHPKMSSATMFKMISFGGDDGWVSTDYTATVRFGVEHKGRPARTLVTKHIVGHTDGRTPFAIRLTLSERRVLRAAAKKAHRRTVIAEISPRPKGEASGGRRLGERRDWLVLTR